MTFCLVMTKKKKIFLLPTLHVCLVAIFEKFSFNFKKFSNIARPRLLKKCGSIDCNCIYIGQTDRTFEVRNLEHNKAFDNKKDISNYANHIHQSNHSYNNDFQILHICNKKEKIRYTGNFRNK